MRTKRRQRACQASVLPECSLSIYWAAWCRVSSQITCVLSSFNFKRLLDIQSRIFTMQLVRRSIAVASSLAWSLYSGLAVTFVTLVTLILFWLIDWLIAWRHKPECRRRGMNHQSAFDDNVWRPVWRYWTDFTGWCDVRQVTCQSSVRFIDAGVCVVLIICH